MTRDYTERVKGQIAIASKAEEENKLLKAMVEEDKFLKAMLQEERKLWQSHILPHVTMQNPEAGTLEAWSRLKTAAKFRADPAVFLSAITGTIFFFAAFCLI